jgi:probable enterotoxin D
VTEDNEVLLAAVQKAVESFTVLNNSAFSSLTGTVVNQTESETETESESNVNAELKTLKDYGTTAILYASDNVNIRLNPSTDTDIIGALSKGDQVTVVGETSQWFKVNINGNIGYISKAFLVNKVSDIPATEATETSATEQTDQSEQTDAAVTDSTKASAELNSYIDYGSGYTYYTTTEVNLRAQPGTDSDVMDSFGGGQAVTVVGETDNWYVVSVNGVKGYVSKSYISSTYTEPTQNDTNNNGTTNNTGNTDNTGNTGTTDTPDTTPSSVGTISGTVIDASATTITVQGDDGNTYTLNTSDASINTNDGIYDGLYIAASVDYNNTDASGTLYATNVTGY